MGTEYKCSTCGKALEANAPGGLCPECLIKVGLGSGVDIGPETQAGAARAPFVPPAVGELAGKFPQLEILELIGKGGMGAVYKARQRELDRIVALKILPPGVGQDAAFAERFTREARALAKLNHPGIVTLYEFGRADGLYFFLMEYVDGVSLQQLLHGGRVSAREALAIVPQICDALQYAHDQGIVHRDIKPENILLDRRGRVKVADFGLAKLVGTDALTPSLSSSLSHPMGEGGTPVPGEGYPPPVFTDASKVMGTPQYMSPEQIAAPGEVDHRADIYALGVVFYQMLTGELPGKPIQPPSKRVSIDVRLDEVVLRALEQKPELRYQQASVLKTQIETISSTPAGGAAAAATPPNAKPSGPRQLNKRSGMVRIVEILADIKFTSPRAIRFVNLSCLGFLAALGFLGFASPKWRGCFGFFGFSGFFGFIGLACIVEQFCTAGIVGRRGGKAVVHWPGALTLFAISLVAAESVTAIGSLVIIQRVAPLPLFTVFFAVCASTAAIVITKLLATPLDKLAPLDAPPAAVAPPMPAPQLRRPWRKRGWASLVVGIVVAVVLRAFFLQAFRAVTDAAAPEIPRSSHFLVWKLAHQFAPGDLIAYRRDGHVNVGRTARNEGNVVIVNRNGETDAAVPRDAVLGKVVSVYWRASASGPKIAGNAATKQKLMAWVEDFFAHNYRDITKRDSLEWGEVSAGAKGNVSIRYKYRATIWDKDIVTNNQVFTFDPQGKFVSVKNVYATPKERMMALVGKFFANNFRDITSRETLDWGEVSTTAEGNTSIRYQYRARIWGKETVTNNQVFTFDAQDKFVSVKDAVPGNPANTGVKAPPTGAVTNLIPLMIERQVNKPVSDFPETTDLSTPESACAAWQRAIARKNAQAVSRLSWVKVDPAEEEAWFRNEEARDPEDLAMYLKALTESKIVVVLTWRDDLADVITFLPFPTGKGRDPYSARSFGRIGNEWKNLGENRLPSLEAARASCDKTKTTIWKQLQEIAQARNMPADSGITVNKGRMMAWVEDFFAHNYRDITKRDTLEWGDVNSSADGNLSIRYKYRATIWDKDIVTNNEVFTFDPQGKFVSVKKVYANPKERMMALVGKFFANNFRDITSRETLDWGDVRTTADGNTSIRYQYRARIWDKETVTNNQVFAFDAQDKFVSVKDAVPGNPANTGVKAPPR